MSKFLQQGALLLLPILIIGCTNTKEKPGNSADSSTQQSPIQLTPNTTSSCKAPLQVVAEWNLAKVDPTVKFATLYISSAGNNKKWSKRQNCQLKKLSHARLKVPIYFTLSNH